MYWFPSATSLHEACQTSLGDRSYNSEVTRGSRDAADTQPYALPNVASAQPARADLSLNEDDAHLS
jgi:hypothetical protein